MARKSPFAVLVALLVAGLPMAARAQTPVRGVVVDQQTGAPVVGAVVVPEGAMAGPATNEAGAFVVTVSGIPGRITVSSIGYKSQTVEVSDASVALRIRLVPAPIPVSGIEVSSSKAKPSVAVLTEHDLQRGDEISLESAINAVPGVFMQSRSPFGGARITIRGYYPSTNGNTPNFNGLGYRVFLNDIPLTDAAGVTILDDVDYASVGSVEVVKGPASSRFGSQIGGAVRFQTARPAPGQRSFTQQVTSGSDGLLRTNTSFATANDRGDVVVQYGYQNYDSFRPHSASTKHYVRASGDFQVDESQTLSAYFAYNRSFEELAGEIDATDFYARRPLSSSGYLANDSHVAITDFLAGMSDQVRLGDRFTNRTTVYGTARTLSQPFAHGFTDTNQFSFGARTEFGFNGTLGGNVGVSGALGGALQRSNIMTNSLFIVPTNPDIQRPTDQENYASNASLFTEWTFDLPARTHLTMGAALARYEYGIRDMLRNGQLQDTTVLRVRTFDPEITPRIALTKELGTHASVSASVSKGYAPPLLAMAVASDGTVNTDLEPERAMQYEIGAQGTLLNGRLAGQIALFDVENSSKLISATENSVTFITNAGKQRNRGAEVSLGFTAIDAPQHTISLVRPWMTYAYIDAEFVEFSSDANHTDATVDYSGNAVPRVPQHMFSAGIDLRMNNGVYAAGTYMSVSEVPVTFDNSAYVDGYDVVAVKAGVDRQVAPHWRLNVFGGADNLTNSTRYAFLFIGPNIEGLATPAGGGHGDGYIIPAPYDRTFYGSVMLSFTP